MKIKKNYASGLLSDLANNTNNPSYGDATNRRAPIAAGPYRSALAVQLFVTK